MSNYSPATTGYYSGSMDEEFEGCGTGQYSSGCDRRRLRQLACRKQPGQSSAAERRALMESAGEDDREADDSDLEQNVSRLCQYLSAASEPDECDTESTPVSSGSARCAGRRKKLKRLADRRQQSVDSSSGCSEGTEGMATELTELQQVPSDKGHKRLGKPMLPHDFLNIPPPAHPPDDSPTLDERPLPPQRQPPPVPPAIATTASNTEEPQYEEARPLAPKPAARPSKSRSGSNPSIARSTNGYEQGISVGNQHYSRTPVIQENDWFDLKANILERNPETGSFYIPSGHTTMSSLSPQSRKLDLDSKHNYSLLPGAGTTVPVNVLPLRPEFTGGSQQAMKTVNRTPPVLRARKTQLKSSAWPSCSWRCLACALCVALIFALAVICYLLVSLLSTSGPSTDYYPGSTRSIHSSDSDSGPVLPLRPLPESFELGDPVVADLPPGVLSYSYFALQRDAHVQFNLSVPAHAKLAIYGRQTLAPSPTQHDFAEIILGEKLHSQAQKRAAFTYGFPEQNLKATVFVQYLLAGRWHLAFLNDDSQVNTLRFSAALTPAGRADGCKYGCYGKGVCKDSKCYCYSGYTGPYCEETVCPVLCSGNGIFTSGRCHCHQGYKGSDCDVPSNVCEVPNCSGHGRCNNYGTCVCDQGWTGTFCDQAACPHPNCSSHGVCADGHCFCEFGWRGDACQEAYTAERLCPVAGTSRQCSGHGTWDPVVLKCLCNDLWTGTDCSQEVCNLDCSGHGTCKDQQCSCDDGFVGEHCDLLACAVGCDEHGTCKNGTCFCSQGWNGDNCQLEGCPKNCNGNGDCVKVGQNWLCECFPSSDSGYTGTACDIPLEFDCADGNDNDNDGLTDCEDSECCSSSSCQQHHLCQTVSDPRIVLIREQAPPPQASFMHKTRFLLQPGSLQQYADQNLFNESRVSVLRGRVLSSKGGALIGVRVSDKANALYGFTISRAGGHFDLMVNGGGSVTIAFMRQPFGSIYRTVDAPWNNIIYVGDVVMVEKEEAQATRPVEEACERQSQMHRLSPNLLPSWKAARFTGNLESQSQVLVDSQVVYQTLALPGSSQLTLNYRSARAAGYQSTLWLHLVPEEMPHNLRLVHLVIDVEGVHYEQKLEAHPNLTYMYGWDKRNVYKQKVYGLTTAKVSAGYVYSGCSQIFWQRRQVKMDGYTSGISDIGGWNLNIHHHFDILSGALEKGDGSTTYLREEEPVMQTTIGTDRQRPLHCPFCNSRSSKVSLFSPMALASGADGSLYVGDYNLIRHISPNDSVTTVLELSPADTAHQYYLAVNPVTDELFVSLPLRRQVWKVRKSLDGAAPPDTAANFEVVVGSGEACVFDQSCGDGGPGGMAQLTFPKGLAFDSRGSLFIADERKIRVVSAHGFIRTLVGSDMWRPLACQSDLSIDELRLQWPTALAVEPLSDRLLILDSDMVIRLNEMGRSARVVIGAPPHCALLNDSNNGTRRPMLLKGATALAVHRDRGILVAETDGKRSHRVRAFDQPDSSVLIAGAESKCNCDRNNCPCDDPALVRARDAHLHRPVALAVGPDGHIHVADQGNYKVRSVEPALPKWDPYSRQYEIYSSDSNEAYLFNRFGQHMATKSLLSDLFIYNFTYHIDTSFGRLTHVTGAGGHRLYLVRKSATEIQIENSMQQKAVARVDNFDKMLRSLQSLDGGRTLLDYDANTQLLVSRQYADGRIQFFDYDDYGHATKMVTATGNVLGIKPEADGKQLVTELSVNGQPHTAFKRTEFELNVEGAHQRSAFVLDNGASFHLQGAGAALNLDSASHSLLAPHQTALLRQKLLLPSMPERLELSARTEWRLYLRRQGRGSSKRIVQVNGLNVLTVEFDRKKNTDKILNQNGDVLLTVLYNNAGFVTRWMPSNSDLASMNISYDSLGRMVGYNWGDQQAQFTYDARGRVTHQSAGAQENILSRKFSYETEDLVLPTSVEVPSLVAYQLRYDSQGALEEILTPTGDYHQFQSLLDMGSLLRVRRVPFSETPFVLAVNDQQMPTALLWPSGSKRVSYLYSQAGNIEQIVHDGRRSVYSYSTETGLLDKVQSAWLRREFVRQGPLIAQMNERHTDPELSETSSAHFSYTYDGRMRVTSVQASLNGELSMESLNLEYEQLSGRLKRIKEFTYQHAGSKVRIMGDNVVIESIMGAERQLAQTRMSVRGRKVCEQQFGYDSVGRLISIDATLMDVNLPVESRTYNADGAISQLNVAGNPAHSWTVHYDLDGRLKAVNSNKLLIENGLPKSLGELSYKTDADGSVIGRGSEKFAYDSFGRLTAAWQKGTYDIRYAYDDQHRVIMRASSGKLLHFYYALPTEPTLLTHIYDSQSQSVSLLYYNEDHTLFAIEKDGSRYFVVSSGDGTPRYVFDNSGSLIKKTFRGPFGQVVADSNPSLELLLGHLGAFQDPESQLLIMNGRPMDPLTGRYMSVWPESLLHGPSPYFPETVDLFGFERTQKAASNWNLDVSDWLYFTGVKLRSLVPLLDSTALSPAFPLVDVLCSQNAVMAAECSIRNRLPHFNRLLTVQPSSVLPSTPYGPAEALRYAISPSVYGQGVTVSNYSGLAVLNVADSVDSFLQDAMLLLLNESTIVPVVALESTQEQIIQHHFWKPNREDAYVQLSELGISGEQATLTPTLNLTVDSDTDSVRVRVHSALASLTVHYGSTLQSVVGATSTQLEQRMAVRVWQTERQAAGDERPTRFVWTDSQLQQLNDDGRVIGLEARLSPNRRTTAELVTDVNEWTLVENLPRT